jgi:hypothetical protein
MNVFTHTKKVIPLGFSTLEIVIALMVISSTLAAVLLIALGIPSAIANGREQELATNKAGDLLEKELSIGIHNFSSVSSIATSTSGIYKISLLVNPSPDGVTERLTSFVGWRDTTNHRRIISLSTILTDFVSGGNTSTCNSIPTGDWTRPSQNILSFSPGNLLPTASTSALYPIDSLAVSSSTLAAGISTTVGKNDPTLFLFNLSSSTNPLYEGSLDNASSTISGVSTISIDGGMLYAAVNSTANFSTCSVSSSCSQLQIFDIRIPTAPKRIASVKLATTAIPFATGSGGQSSGKSILVQNGIAYLGLTKSGNNQGDEFNIIDVHNPPLIAWLGGYSVGRSINQIQVVGNYAYLATDNPSGELLILNIQNPSHITLAGTYDAPGSLNTFGLGEAVAVSNSVVALGRSYISTNPEFILLNNSQINSSSSPSLLGTIQVGTPANSVSIEGIILREYLSFILTTTSLLLWNTLDPLHPTLYATPISLSPNSGLKNTAFVCRHNSIYVASVDSKQNGFISVLTAY